MKDVLIGLVFGILAFAYLLVVPIMLWKAPTMEEDDYEEDYFTGSSDCNDDADVSKCND